MELVLLATIWIRGNEGELSYVAPFADDSVCAPWVVA